MGEENAPPKFSEPYVEEFTRVCTFIRQVLGSNLNALLSGSISILLDCIIELKANIETCSPENFYIHRLSPKQLFDNLVTFVTWCDSVYGNHQSIESQQPPHQTLPNIDTTFNFETITNNGNVIKEYEKARDNYIGLMHLQRVESEFYRLVQGMSFAKEKSVKTLNKNYPKISEAISNESMDKNVNTNDYKSNQSLSSINSLLLTDNSIYDGGSQYFEPNRNNSSKELEKIGNLTTSICEPKYGPPLIKMTSSDFGDTGKMNVGNRDSQIFSSEDTECTSNNSMFDLNSEDSYYEKSSSLGYSSSLITLANNRNSNTPKQSLDNNHTQKNENTNNRKEKSKIRRPTPLNLSADKNYGEGFHEEKNSKSQIPSNTECPQKYVPPWVKKLIEPSNPVKNQQFVPENYFLNANKCTEKEDFSKSDMNTSLLNFVQTPTLLEHSHKFSLHEYGGIKDKNEDGTLPKQTQMNIGKNFTKNNDVNHQSFHNNLREHRNNSSPTPSVSTLTEYSMLSDCDNRSQSTYTYNNEVENGDEFNLQTFMRNKKNANHRLFMTSSPDPSKEEGGTFRNANNIGNEKTEKNDRIKAKAKLVRKTVLEIKLPRGVQASQVLQELNRRLVDIEHTNTNKTNCKNDEKSDQNNSSNKKVIHSENNKIDFMEGDIIDSVILEQRDDYGENASISNIFTPKSLTSRNSLAENCFSVLTPPSSPIPLNSLQAKNRIQPNNIDQARYVISRPANDNNKNTDEQMQKVAPKINNTSSSEKFCEKTCEENSKNLAALDCETENEIERLLSSMQSTVQELTDSQRSCLNDHKNNSTSHCQNTTSTKNLNNNNQTLDDNISISTINTTFNNLFGNRDSDSSVFSIESGQIFTFDRASINSDNNKTTYFDQAGVTKKLGQQSNSFLAKNINNNKKSFDQDQGIDLLNCNNRSNKDIKNHQMNKDVIGYVKKVHETGRNYIKDTHSYYFKTIPTNGQEEPSKACCKKKSETINNKDSNIMNNHPKTSENVTNYVKTIGEYNGLAMDTDPFSFIKESTEYFIKDIEKYWKTLNIYTDLSENTIPFDNDKRNERFLSSTSNLNENNRQKLPKVSKLLPNIQIKSNQNQPSNQTCLQNAIITEGNLFEHIIQDFTQLSSKPKPNINNRNLAPQNQRPPQEEQIYDRIDVCNFKNARKNGSTFNNTNYSDNKIINNLSVQDRECRIFDAYHFKASSNKINLDNRPAAKISEPFTSNTTLYKLRRSDSAKETIEQQHPQNLSPHSRINDNRSFHFTGRDTKIIYSDDTLVSRLNQKDSHTLQKPKLRLEGQERDIITLLKSPMTKPPSTLLKPSMIKPILKRQSSISTSSYETYNTSSTKTGTKHSDTLENNVYNIKPPLPETVKTEYQTSLYDLVPKDINLIFRDTQTQLNSSNEANLNIADNCTSKSTLPYRNTLVNGKHRKFVQSGSIIAFIVYATCPMQNDFLFQEAFVLTYRLFMTPCVLLDLLIKRLSHFQRACVNGSTLFKRAYRSTFSFLYRILDDVSFNEITDATKYIINNDGFNSSISDKLLLQSLKHQIQSMFEIGEIQLATILQGKLESKLMNNENGLTKSTIMFDKTGKMINFSPLSPALMSTKTENNNINTGIPCPLTNSPYYMARKDTEPKFKFDNDFTELFLNAKSRDIAEQLTFLDAQLFCRLSMNECLIWALKRNENLTPNLSTFTKHFNDVSYWCRTMILAPPIGIKRRKNSKDSQHNFNHINNLTTSFCNTTPNLTNTNDANNQITQEFISGLRLKIYRKFLKVMRHLRYEYYNFNALLALLSALDSSPISRLLEDNSYSKGTPSPCNSPCKKYYCPDKNRNQGVFDKSLNNNNLSQKFSYNNANKSDAAVDHGMNYQRRLSDNLLSRNKSKMETSPFFATKQRKRSLSRGRRPKSPSSEILVMSPKSNLIARKSFGTPQNFMRGDNITTNSSAISTNSNAFINPTRNKDEKFLQTPAAAPMLNLIKLTDKEMTLLQTLRELVDSSGSFKNYRKTLAEIVPPCIPYVGLILQDLTFIDVGNPTYTPDGLINFVKCWQLFSVLHSLKRFKNKTYKIKQDEQIISIFDNFQYHLADDELWNISETIKPRRKIL